MLRGHGDVLQHVAHARVAAHHHHVGLELLDRLGQRGIARAHAQHQRAGVGERLRDGMRFLGLRLVRVGDDQHREALEGRGV
jgi:hypothetical protein